MTWTKYVAFVTMALNVGLMVALVVLVCKHLRFQQINETLPVTGIERLTVATIKEETDACSEGQAYGQWKGQANEALEVKPVLFTGVKSSEINTGERQSLLTLLNNTDVPTILLHKFHLKDDAIQVLNSGFYHLDINILYHNRSDSPIRLLLECLHIVSSRGPLILGMASNWCRKRSYCSISQSGTYELNDGDSLQFEVNHGEFMVKDLKNTHVSLFMI